MSSADVELVRKGFDAAARRDAATLDTLVHPEIEFRSSLAGAEGRSYHGLLGIRQYFDDLESAWERWDIKDPEYISVGDGKVLVLFEVEARGRASGVPIEQRFGQIWTLRDGKVVLGVSYTDQAEALRAAGLKPTAR